MKLQLNTTLGLLRQTWPMWTALAFGLGTLWIFEDKLIITLYWLASWAACFLVTVKIWRAHVTREYTQQQLTHDQINTGLRQSGLQIMQVVNAETNDTVSNIEQLKSTLTQTNDIDGEIASMNMEVAIESKSNMDEAIEVLNQTRTYIEEVINKSPITSGRTFPPPLLHCNMKTWRPRSLGILFANIRLSMPRLKSLQQLLTVLMIAHCYLMRSAKNYSNNIPQFAKT